jgi:Fe-S-cluster containining protein
MLSAQEKTELTTLDKRVEKETLGKLRANRTIDFAVRFAAFAQAEVDRARAHVVSKGVEFDCKKGCAYCCHFRVESLPQETFRIAREIRSRGDAGPVIAALEAFGQHVNGLKRDRNAGPCPFLVENACSIYAVRPVMCRKCNSLDVATCKDPDATVLESAELVYKTGAILQGTTVAYEKSKLTAAPHELTRGVLLALTDPTAEQRWLRGEDVFAIPPGSVEAP